MTKLELKTIRDEVVEVMLNSKATFFVSNKKEAEKLNKLTKEVEEVLYEQKSEIVTNVEMYFVSLLEKFTKNKSV